MTKTSIREIRKDAYCEGCRLFDKITKSNKEEIKNEALKRL